MSIYTEKAQAIYSTNCNCAQSTLAAFGALTGLDEETAMRLTAPLGGGIAKTGICGAISGSLLAAGLLKGYGYDPSSEEKSAFSGFVKTFVEGFRQEFGAVDCVPLLAKNEEDGLTDKPCMRYVTGAVSLLESML